MNKIVNQNNSEFQELLTLLPFKVKDYENCLDDMEAKGQIEGNDAIMHITGRNLHIHWTKVGGKRFEYSGCSVVDVDLYGKN